MKFQSLLVVAGCAIALIGAAPPPSPPPINSTAPTVQAGTTPAPLRTFVPLFTPAPTPKVSGSPTPPPDNRKGLTGVWEIQIQHPNVVEYEHFNLIQKASNLSGFYLDNQTNKRYPLNGTVDGTNVQVIVTLADGSTMLFQGKADGTTDMLGLLTDAKDPSVPFTAAYRPKEKLIDNVSPDPTGGLQTAGSGTNGQLPPPP